MLQKLWPPFSAVPLTLTGLHFTVFWCVGLRTEEISIYSKLQSDKRGLHFLSIGMSMDEPWWTMIHAMIMLQLCETMWHYVTMGSGQEQQVQERQNAWGELHSDQLAAAKAYEKCFGWEKLGLLPIVIFRCAFRIPFSSILQYNYIKLCKLHSGHQGLLHKGWRLAR